MKRIKALLSKWYVPLILILVPMIMGLTGYIIYYRALDTHPAFKMPFYSTLKLFGLGFDFNYEKVKDRMAGSEWVYGMMAVTRYLAIIPSGTAILKLLHTLMPELWTRIYFAIWRRRKNRLLLVGSNADNLRIYESAEKGMSGMILAEKDKDTKKLRDRSVHYYSANDAEAMEQTICGQIRSVFSQGHKALTLIINTQNDEIDLRLCRAAAECVRSRVDPLRKEIEILKKEQRQPEEIEKEKRVVDALNRIRIVTVGDSDHQAVYMNLQGEACGVLKYTNKYQITAVEFIQQHPITEHIVPDMLEGNGCLTENSRFNVIFVGFGDTNRELFRYSFAANQLIGSSETGFPEMKPVHYHVFDKKDVLHDKNLNHSVFRYCESFWKAVRSGRLKQTDYLELPPVPAVITPHVVDINDEAYYEEIWDTCIENPDAVNYLIIAFSDDLNNIDLARRMAEKKNEWDLKNLHIFVKVRKQKNAEVDLSLPGGKLPYTPFGSEEYDLKALLSNEAEDIAYRRRLSDSIERYREKNSIPKTEIEIAALYDWYMMEQDRRLSNVFNILGLHVKLHLMGLDYRPETGRGLTNDEYFGIYANGNEPEKSKDAVSYRRAIYSYEGVLQKGQYRKDDMRTNLAVQEHYRWNAYMIARGFVPASFQQMREQKVRDYKQIRFTAA